MRFFGHFNWLESPADREIIQKWTVGSGEPLSASRHSLVFPPPADPNNFEFLALGDTGDSYVSSRLESPQDAVARSLMADLALPKGGGKGEFILHLGDVIYMTGERKLYQNNFYRPYAPLISAQSTPENTVFRLPFLPVPGNHDYYDPGAWIRWLLRTPILSEVMRRISREVFGFVLPEGGSDKGRAFMEVFVNASADTSNSPLIYQPEVETRLPNRYYKFSVGSVDFFMLDSNTLDAPPPSISDSKSVKQEALRRITTLENQARDIKSQLKRLNQNGVIPRNSGLETIDPHPGDTPSTTEDDYADAAQLSEKALDIQRELALEKRRLHYTPEDYDTNQFEWFRAALEESCANRPNSWRIVGLHHPLYTTIGNHCEGRDVKSVRENLMGILQDKVHLVLSGHSHSFEWIHSNALPNTGLFVTGGGGQISLRRSILDPRKLFLNRERYESLQMSGVTECAAGGRGPVSQDGQRGPIYHYLKISVTPDSLQVQPIGMRRLPSTFRQEVPMPVFHAPKLTENNPAWHSRCLHSVEIRRQTAPKPIWANP